MLKFASVVVLLGVFGLSGCDEEEGHGHGSTGEVLDLLSNADVVAGELRFMETCGRSVCHGVDGSSGNGPMLSVVLLTHDDIDLAAVIRNGEGQMPPQMSVLTDSAIADVMVYVRGRWPSE